MAASIADWCNPSKVICAVSALRAALAVEWAVLYGSVPYLNKWRYKNA